MTFYNGVVLMSKTPVPPHVRVRNFDKKPCIDG